MAAEKKFRFSIDRGGTFTDVYAECPGGRVRVMKLLSEDPTNYPDAPREAIRRILEEVRRCIANNSGGETLVPRKSNVPKL